MTLDGRAELTAHVPAAWARERLLRCFDYGHPSTRYVRNSLIEVGLHHHPPCALYFIRSRVPHLICATCTHAYARTCKVADANACTYTRACKRAQCSSFKHAHQHTHLSNKHPHVPVQARVGVHMHIHPHAPLHSQVGLHAAHSLFERSQFMHVWMEDLRITTATQLITRLAAFSGLSLPPRRPIIGKCQTPSARAPCPRHASIVLGQRCQRRGGNSSRLDNATLARLRRFFAPSLASLATLLPGTFDAAAPLQRLTQIQGNYAG